MLKYLLPLTLASFLLAFLAVFLLATLLAFLFICLIFRTIRSSFCTHPHFYSWNIFCIKISVKGGQGMIFFYVSDIFCGVKMELHPQKFHFFAPIFCQCTKLNLEIINIVNFCFLRVIIWPEPWAQLLLPHPPTWKGLKKDKWILYVPWNFQWFITGRLYIIYVKTFVV